MCDDDRVHVRYVSDFTRTNVSAVIAGAVAFIAFAVVMLIGGRADLAQPLDAAATFYLLWWPCYMACFVTWTHIAYTNRTPQELKAAARTESRFLKRWWVRILGHGDALSWTVTGATVAVVLTVIIAQTPTFRDDLLFVILGLLSVASSWAVMVYAFALEYLRLASQQDDTPEGRHIELDLTDEPRFGDYLTLAVLLSTMAATVSATIRSRRAWTLVRINVLLAFAVNTVIVSMMVSLLFGGLVE